MKVICFATNWIVLVLKTASNPRRNFSLVARYSLKFTRCSLLVLKSLVICCKSARYLLQKLLVARIYPLLVPQVARCKNSLATRCKIFSLLVAEKVTHCKKSLVSRCEIRLLLVATNHLLLYEKHHSPLVKTILSP